jgi:hypothetical protein
MKPIAQAVSSGSTRAAQTIGYTRAEQKLGAIARVSGRLGVLATLPGSTYRAAKPSYSRPSYSASSSPRTPSRSGTEV